MAQQHTVAAPQVNEVSARAACAGWCRYCCVRCGVLEAAAAELRQDNALAVAAAGEQHRAKGHA